jgi:hypothetical protein
MAILHNFETPSYNHFDVNLKFIAVGRYGPESPSACNIVLNKHIIKSKTKKLCMLHTQPQVGEM